MHFFEIIIIGIALSMDSFAVSIANGIKIKEINIKHVLKIASSFSLFQAIMPVIGYFLGLSLKSFIQSVDHWIAFTLLGLIGIKMIYESLKTKDDSQSFFLKKRVIISQSIATSIDALIIGTGLAFLGYSITVSAILIGITTFIFSFCGVYLGKKCGDLLKNKAEIIGGLILIVIGFKVLIDHLIK